MRNGRLNKLARLALTAAVPLTLLTAAFGQIAAPVTGPGIQMIEVGIYCQPREVGREEAPGTAIGYIKLFDVAPVIRFHQQQVPAALGISFGFNTISDREIDPVRMETWKPGATEPEIWHGRYGAELKSSRGYSFDFKDELILGLWRLEAWDDETLLYSVTFEVVPAATLPEVIAYCEPAIS